MFKKTNLENIEELAQKKEIRQLYMKTGLMKKGYCDMSSLCGISIVMRQVLLRNNEFVAFP
jgi:aerobic-type carbon monoxide dehydrogenase small subunit (CoxS/CutS family)